MSLTTKKKRFGRLPSTNLDHAVVEMQPHHSSSHQPVLSERARHSLSDQRLGIRAFAVVVPHRQTTGPGVAAAQQLQYDQQRRGRKLPSIPLAGLGTSRHGGTLINQFNSWPLAVVVTEGVHQTECSLAHSACAGSQLKFNMHAWVDVGAYNCAPAS